MSYVGAALKLTEAQLAIQPIQMGARVYIPGLGRFLQVDPVQGGTPNNYVYPPEPVNNYDLTGTIAPLLVALAPFIGRVAVGVAVKIAVSNSGKKVAQQAVTKAATKTITKNIANKSAGTAPAMGKLQTLPNLNKELFLKQVQSYGSRLEGARPIMQNKIADPRFQVIWQKFQYTEKLGDGTKLTVHWFENILTGEITQLKYVR